jgi:hypothetical protein
MGDMIPRRWMVLVRPLAAFGTMMATACSSNNDTALSGGAGDDGGVDTDPLCNTMPVELTVHPHAPAQATEIGQDLVDTRGWHGRLYFGYGDLDKNTGPIVVSSYDPVAGTWIDHFTFQTERIERFAPLGDRLFAPAADPHPVDPNDLNEPQPDYAVGTATHDWSPGGIDFGPSLHVLDAAERAPGDVYMVGWDWFDPKNFIVTATVWRSLDGGPFQVIFPTNDPTVQNSQHGSGFITIAALNGKVYPGLGWEFDGQSWYHSAVNFGEFTRPTTFAGKIVSSTLGELWASDGAHMKNLGIVLWDTPGLAQLTLLPLALFQQTEGHLIAVNAEGSVVSTTDLVKWTCIGKAPPDVRSIGSLDGKIYFGGTAGRVYGYTSPSW